MTGTPKYLYLYDIVGIKTSLYSPYTLLFFFRFKFVKQRFIFYQLVRCSLRGNLIDKVPTRVVTDTVYARFISPIGFCVTVRKRIIKAILRDRQTGEKKKRHPESPYFN